MASAVEMLIVEVAGVRWALPAADVQHIRAAAPDDATARRAGEAFRSLTGQPFRAEGARLLLTTVPAAGGAAVWIDALVEMRRAVPGCLRRPPQWLAERLSNGHLRGFAVWDDLETILLLNTAALSGARGAGGSRVRAKGE